MGKTKTEDTCIECGCTEFNACQPNRKHHDPCHWLVIDRRTHVGVCSRCPGALKRWDAGDRTVKKITHQRKAA